MSKYRESLLWSLQGPDQRMHYVYGTIHLQDDRVFIFADTVLSYLEKVDVLACEVSLDEMNPLLWQQVFHLPEGHSLKNLLGAKSFEKLETFNQQYFKLPSFQLDRLSPFLVINMMSQAYFESNQQINLDGFLFESARQMGKSLAGLEPFEEQLSYVSRISMVDQVRSLKKALSQTSKLKQQHQQALCYYQEQRIKELYQQSRKSLGKWRKIMINERNKKMVESFLHLAKDERVMAAVGAAHLSGQFGLLRLLKHKGFRVRPISI